MVLNLIRRLSSGTAPYFYLAISLLVLAWLLTTATEDSSALNELFLLIFAVGLLCLLLLAGILARSLYCLFRDFRQNQPGSRLTTRLVSLFVMLILGATTIVYSFSLHFLHRGINSWFDINVEQALTDSLELSRTAFGIRMRTLLRQTRMMAGVLSEIPDENLGHNLRELIKLSGALEVSIWTIDGQLVMSSVDSPMIMVPERPSESILRQLQTQEDYIGMDPGEDDELQLRAAVLIPTLTPLTEQRILHVMFPVNRNLSILGKTVQDAYTDYLEISYLRKPLITIFTLTLSLIVFLTILASLWFAVWISRRLVQPLQSLAEGTQAVAAGNYNMKLDFASHDEIGFLVRSFNQMTERLTQARNASQRSHDLLEQQTSYLSTVLGSLSTGVITIDNDNYLRTANIASHKILGVNLQEKLASPLPELVQLHDNLEVFCQLIEELSKRNSSWQQQVDLTLNKGRQTLMLNGTPLPSNSGWVIVFDDITALLQAQRHAAWGEVARRLAHEIKNPLTPIQLSAERLQHKYQPLLPDDQAPGLSKLTSTIIHQVEAMKIMVDEFSEYARSPALQLQTHSIGELIREVLAMYQSNPNHQFVVLKSHDDIKAKIDSNRFRQVLHNLLKNAIEASEEAGQQVDIVISYHATEQDHRRWLEIIVTDQGPGFPDDMADTLFEPYTTTKLKGTGLGLAIVRKIIEEHGGTVWAENLQPEGASIIIRLPLEEPES